MSSIKQKTDGFRLAPGRYAIVAQDWSGDIPDPRSDAAEYSSLHLPAVTEATLVSYENIDILILPIGRDSAGGTGRSIAVGHDTVVAFDRIAIVAVDEMAQRRHYRYASHIDEVGILDVEDGLIVIPCEAGYEFDGRDGNDFHEGIGTSEPGAFSIDGDFFDMADRHVAKAFGYGTEAFNAALDEHGFPCDLAALRRRIDEEMDGPHAVILRNRLSGLGDFAIAYYAPVQP